MLRVITGGSGSGKSYELLCRLEEQVRQGKQVLFLVPEQFSFETERTLLHRIGLTGMRQTEVLSFTRLAKRILQKYSAGGRVYADMTAKTVTMQLALQELEDTLVQYRRAVGSKGYIRSFLEAVEELKFNGITSERLEAAAGAVGDEIARQKLQEISQIYAVYGAILERRYADTLDDLALANRLARENGYFLGKVIYMDEFKGFTKPEYDLLETLFAQCEECQVSLCFPALHGQENLFGSVTDTYRRLLRLANKADFPVAVPEKRGENRRTMHSDLRHLEANVLRTRAEPFAGNSEHIRLFYAQNEYEEVDYALSTIRKWVEKLGYRYRDVVIMSRDTAIYHDILETAFEKYHIPYFMDQADPIDGNPLVRFVLTLSGILAGGYDTVELLKLFKCGLLPFSYEEVAQLENYTYTWEITGRKWQSEFSLNPRGFGGALTEQDSRALKQINRLRRFVVGPIEAFRRKVRENPTYQTLVEAFYKLLQKLHLEQAVKKIIGEMEGREAFESAQEYLRVWEILVGILDHIFRSGGEVRCTIRQFAELLELSVLNSELSERPQTLDCVMVGAIDRMRTNSPKAVILLGANEGLFPYLPVSTGLLGEREKELLTEQGLEFNGDYRQRVVEERFIAYKALCCSTEQMLLTTRQADVSGALQAPSDLLEELRTLYGEKIAVYAEQVDPLYYCDTPETAFSQLAYHYREDTPFTATLRTYMQENERYRSKVALLEAMQHRESYLLKDKETAKQLFGDRMRLSPSRIDQFYRCKFAYFCYTGLRVRPRQKAELNPLARGNVIHELLYRLISGEGEILYAMDDNALRREIRRLLREYLEEVMGGDQEKTARFRYLYGRLNRTLFHLVKRLVEEFKQCDFKPSDFELDISESEDVEPLQLKSVDGTEVMVIGKIDRVDTYRDERGQLYVRVVDYKSGMKQFKLNELYYGLNLQMILYLFTIWKNGKNRYQNTVPAGVLYMPSGELSPTLDKSADGKTRDEEKMRQYKMNGFVLESEPVVEAMERDIKGVFIPVAKNKDGSFSRYSSLLKLEELGKLERYIDRLVLDMAQELHNGNIANRPTHGAKETPPCQYCDYRSLCGHRSPDDYTEVLAYDKNTFLKEIEGGGLNGGNALDDGAGKRD